MFNPNTTFNPAFPYAVVCASAPHENSVFKTLDECWGLCLDLSEEYGHSEVWYINNMNNSIKTKSLFSQSIDLTDDYLSLEYVKSFSSNMFDKYTRDNNLDPHLAIYHYGNDRFVVQTMDYKYDGCLSGCSVQLGQFYDIYEAQDCAEDYLKDLLISQGV